MAGSRKHGHGRIPIIIVVIAAVFAVGIAIFSLNGEPEEDNTLNEEQNGAGNVPELDGNEGSTPVEQGSSDKGDNADSEYKEDEEEVPAGQQQETQTDDGEQKAREILSNMSLEEKIGQMFIARCPGENAVEKVGEYHLGGYILFASDFKDETVESAREKIGSYQAAADIPLLIGVDEEGGTVNRISRYTAFRQSPFKSPQELYQEGGLEAIEADTSEKCQLLTDLGVNVNFAPVCDVSQNPDDFIYQRSFGKDALETAEYVETVVEAMADSGVACVLKHFPGYGDNQDTHTGIARDNRPLENFETSDFLPFEAGIDAGAQIVLVCHNIVECMDPDHPASISPPVHRILREQLGFEGVIVTDDLAMDGIRDFVADDQAAVMAVQAGNDLLCCTDFETQVPAVVEAVQSGVISEERIDQSVLRILELKIELGLIDTDAQ